MTAAVDRMSFQRRQKKSWTWRRSMASDWPSGAGACRPGHVGAEAVEHFVAVTLSKPTSFSTQLRTQSYTTKHGKIERFCAWLREALWPDYAG